jgi:hypothetical protein
MDLRFFYGGLCTEESICMKPVACIKFHANSFLPINISKNYIGSVSVIKKDDYCDDTISIWRRILIKFRFLLQNFPIAYHTY